jgi:hypothetical protein
LVGRLDVATVVDQFLKAPPNPRAQYGTNQQSLVVSNMNTFFSTYNNWAAAGFPHLGNQSNQTPAYVTEAQVNMMTAVQGLYKSTAYNPPPVPCPP